MSTEAALLRAIREMPDEDPPRLVYADYLDEEGHAARAEFIRLQVERAGRSVEAIIGSRGMKLSNSQSNLRRIRPLLNYETRGRFLRANL